MSSALSPSLAPHGAATAHVPTPEQMQASLQRLDARKARIAEMKARVLALKNGAKGQEITTTVAAFSGTAASAGPVVPENEEDLGLLEAGVNETQDANLALSRRDEMLRTQEEINTARDNIEVYAKNKVGAGKKTIDTLLNMSANAQHFLDLSDLWESKDAGVRRQKDEYGKMRDYDRAVYLGGEETVDKETGKKVYRTWGAAETEAWRNRPPGCGDLMDALLMRKAYYRKSMNEDPWSTGRDLDAAGERRMVDAIATLEKFRNTSVVRRFMPHAGGLVKMQIAGSELAAVERKLGGPMENKDKYERWPCLQLGWPDEKAMAKKKLKFELALAARERPGLMEPDLNGAPPPRPKEKFKVVNFTEALADLPEEANGTDELPTREQPANPGVSSALFGDEDAEDCPDADANAEEDVDKDVDESIAGDVPPSSFTQGYTESESEVVDRRFEEGSPRKKARTNALPEAVQAYANTEVRYSPDHGEEHMSQKALGKRKQRNDGEY